MEEPDHLKMGDDGVEDNEKRSGGGEGSPYNSSPFSSPL
jgi:hypothetical protein